MCFFEFISHAAHFHGQSTHKSKNAFKNSTVFNNFSIYFSHTFATSYKKFSSILPHISHFHHPFVSCLLFTITGSSNKKILFYFHARRKFFYMRVEKECFTWHHKNQLSLIFASSFHFLLDEGFPYFLIFFSKSSWNIFLAPIFFNDEKI